jgi:uncharacterized membrane protein YfcA
MLALLPFLGVASGALTTLAGLGGGILLLLALSLAWGPTAALAATAPALLLSNLHRFWMFRRDADRRVAVAFIAGALPGSIAGGAFAARVPEGILAWLMAAMTALALTRAFGWWKWEPRRSLLLPAGVGIGMLTGTSGGAGVLVAPLLLSTGLTGQAYVATAAICAVAMHTGRVLAYGAGGLVSGETLVRTGILTVALLFGNLVGKRLRARILDDRRAQRLEMATLVVCVGLSIAGVGR